MSPNPLRNVPSVNELLENPRLRKLVDRISHNAVVSTVRNVLDEVRNEVQSAAAEKTLPSVSELADRIVRRVMETEKLKLQPVINATGILLHPELGGSPLAEEAIAAISAVAGDYASVDLDLASGRQSPRAATVECLLKEITGAEAALVVNSKASAIMLTLFALAADREVIVSRGQLVATADSYSLSELMAASGAVLLEVGATNITRPHDYEQAIGEPTGALMLAHPSNFAVVGFSESVSLDELVEVGRRHELPVIHDIGYGGLIDLDELGFAGEPTAGESIQAGADLVLFGGDKLLGGPHCGIIVGQRPLVERIEEHLLSKTLRVDKLTLAALEVTLRLSRDPEKAIRAIPLLSLLCTSVDNLQNRAERLAPQLAAAEAVAEAEPVVATTYLAGVPVPTHELPTRCLAITPEGMSADRMAAALRSDTPPVVGRVRQDRLMLDLRSVLPRQDQGLVEAFSSLGSAAN